MLSHECIDGIHLLILIQWVVVVFRRELTLYLNAFSGDATVEFPSTLQMARGGVSLNYVVSNLHIFAT